MDDLRSLVLEVIGAAVVLGAAMALSWSFRTAPLLTVLGGLLLLLLIGSSLYMYLSRRSDSGLSRRRLAFVVVSIIAISLGLALVIYIADVSDLLT